jgi:hypothetical protein
MKLTSHLHLVSRLGISGATPLLIPIYLNGVGREKLKSYKP